MKPIGQTLKYIFLEVAALVALVPVLYVFFYSFGYVKLCC